jgi:hypothetical protein
MARASAGLTFVWARADGKATNKRNVITQAVVLSLVIVMPMSPSLICVSFATWEMAEHMDASRTRHETSFSILWQMIQPLAVEQIHLAREIRQT